MLPENPLQRRFAMFQMFARHYADRFMGNAYPSAIDAVPALLTVYEKQVLYRLAQCVPRNGQIVEIGSFTGGSTCCLAAGSQKNTVTVHAVDTFMTENVEGQEGRDTFNDFKKHTRPYASLIQAHRGFSHEVVDNFIQPIDLLFVDGDHSWEGVTRDLRCYLPKLQSPAILVMHDSAYPPVKKAIVELILPLEIKCLAALPNLYAGLINPQNV